MLTLAHVALADPLDERVRQIAKQLQCPVCESVSVADSSSELAGQMRGLIRARLEAGESEQQIVQYFVERYGDQVLVEPPRRGWGLIVWWAPIAVLAAGAVVLVALLRAWVRKDEGERGTRPHPRPLPGGEGVLSLPGGEAVLPPLPLGEGRGEGASPEAEREPGAGARDFAELARREFERFRREVGE
ncbi:MAG: cytochrome c-type biogenesis protein CcmH [Chloroflexi bacterium]|nr:cytochrome c-type biogenesis protein CcmH [Chloroflexota bacterium]